MPLVRGHYPTISTEWSLAGKPSGLYRQNITRGDCITDNATALTSQVMLSAAVPLEAGDVVSNITFMSGATAAGAPTNWWFALFDDQATPALLGQTADQLTAAWAAHTAKTLALASQIVVPRQGIYYAAAMVKATTVPSLIGRATLADATAAWLAGEKTLAQSSGSALTGTAPATIATPTAVGFVPRVVLT
jgi:hypothetical protein